MSAMRECSRYELLLSQFELDEEQNITNVKSFERIFNFLYEHTNIYYLGFIKEEILIQYLEYHRTNQFKDIPFLQAVKDVKQFQKYLRNHKQINHHVSIDLSLKNYERWINL
ncbi:hypothetical protein ACFFF5_15120 [Lederbergia wuyishanensis]|uniref:Uncharacterized protein n=1 Tax=Lederbergia wuyishanensis TaxID=1347903 RepID=A0ABU0D3K7_9BACI|nr:hypothetical protein [Lederbergia wuyishanensis]MCJ8007890.1 hypothetical protein [Lederbergia wuyishanensis]MDQ0342943.1 hypothetical protein [Lederbergia wuyishanensis]